MSWFTELLKLSSESHMPHLLVQGLLCARGARRYFRLDPGLAYLPAVSEMVLDVLRRMMGETSAYMAAEGAAEIAQLAPLLLRAYA